MSKYRQQLAIEGCVVLVEGAAGGRSVDGVAVFGFEARTACGAVNNCIIPSFDRLQAHLVVFGACAFESDEVVVTYASHQYAFVSAVDDNSAAWVA